jgi:hypothetical protein
VHHESVVLLTWALPSTRRPPGGRRGGTSRLRSQTSETDNDESTEEGSSYRTTVELQNYDNSSVSTDDGQNGALINTMLF